MNSPLFELRQHFDLVDPIRDHLRLAGLSPPAVMVIGNEDCGKSSLLNGLIGIDLLPQSDNVTTRCPIELRLRRRPGFHLRIEIVTGIGSRTVYVDNDVGGYDSGYVRAQMHGVLSSLNAEFGNRIVSDRTIVATYGDPNVPDIDLVDLPGMMNVARDDFPADTPAVTKNLVMEYLRTRFKQALLLMVVDATNKPNQTKGSEIINEFRLHDRTIGVLTRADIMSREQRRKFLTPILRQDHGAPIQRLKHGYYATAIKDESGQWRDQNAELAWFQLDDGIPADTQARCGVRELIKEITKMVGEFLRESWFPEAIKIIDQALSQKHGEFYALGVPIESDLYGNVVLRVEHTLTEDRLRQTISRGFMELSYTSMRASVGSIEILVKKYASKSPPKTGRSVLDNPLRQPDAGFQTGIQSLVAFRQAMVTRSPDAQVLLQLRSTLETIYNGAVAIYLKTFEHQVQNESTLKILRFKTNFAFVFDGIQRLLENERGNFVERVVNRYMSDPKWRNIMAQVGVNHLISEEAQNLVDEICVSLFKVFTEFPTCDDINEEETIVNSRRTIDGDIKKLCEAKARILARKF